MSQVNKQNSNKMENRHSDWLWATGIVAVAYLASKVIDKCEKYVIRKEKRLLDEKTSKSGDTESTEPAK